MNLIIIIFKVLISFYLLFTATIGAFANIDSTISTSNITTASTSVKSLSKTTLAPKTLARRQAAADDFSLPSSARALANSRTADPWFLSDDDNNININNDNYVVDKSGNLLIDGSSSGNHIVNNPTSFVNQTKPYRFSYNVRGSSGRTEQYRREIGNGKYLSGSYGYMLPDGIYRHVDYVADERGFKAYIRTSEPGTTNSNPADVIIDSNPLSKHALPSASYSAYNRLFAPAFSPSAPGDIPARLPPGAIVNNELQVGHLSSWWPHLLPKIDSNYHSTLERLNSTKQPSVIINDDVNQSSAPISTTTTTLAPITSQSITTEKPLAGIDGSMFESLRPHSIVNTTNSYSSLRAIQSPELPFMSIDNKQTDYKSKIGDLIWPFKWTTKNNLNSQTSIQSLNDNINIPHISLLLQNKASEHFKDIQKEQKRASNKLAYDKPLASQYRDLSDAKLTYGYASLTATTDLPLHYFQKDSKPADQDNNILKKFDLTATDVQRQKLRLLNSLRSSSTLMPRLTSSSTSTMSTALPPSTVRPAPLFDWRTIQFPLIRNIGDEHNENHSNKSYIGWSHRNNNNNINDNNSNINNNKLPNAMNNDHHHSEINESKSSIPSSGIKSSRLVQIQPPYSTNEWLNHHSLELRSDLHTKNLKSDDDFDSSKIKSKDKIRNFDESLSNQNGLDLNGNNNNKLNDSRKQIITEQMNTKHENSSIKSRSIDYNGLVSNQNVASKMPTDLRTMQASFGLPLPPRKLEASKESKIKVNVNKRTDVSLLNEQTKEKSTNSVNESEDSVSRFDATRLSVLKPVKSSTIELEKFKSRLKSQLDKGYMNTNELNLNGDDRMKFTNAKLNKIKNSELNYNLIDNDNEFKLKNKTLSNESKGLHSVATTTVSSVNSFVKYDEEPQIAPNNDFQRTKQASNALLKQRERQTQASTVQREHKHKRLSVSDSLTIKNKTNINNNFVNQIKNWPSLLGAGEVNGGTQASIVSLNKTSDETLIPLEKQQQQHHRTGEQRTTTSAATITNTELGNKQQQQVAIDNSVRKLNITQSKKQNNFQQDQQSNANKINMNFINSVTALSVDSQNPFAFASANPSLKQSKQIEQTASSTPLNLPPATDNARFTNSADLIALAERAALADRMALLDNQLNDISFNNAPANHRTHAPYTMLDTDNTMLTSASSVLNIIDSAKATNGVNRRISKQFVKATNDDRHEKKKFAIADKFYEVPA